MLSSIFLCWTLRPLRLGFKRSLLNEDVPQLPTKLKLIEDEENIDVGTKAFRSVVDRDPAARDKMKKELSVKQMASPYLILKCIWILQKVDLMLGILCGVAQGVTFSVGRPLLLRTLIGQIQKKNTTGALLTVLYLAILLFIEAIIQTWQKQFLSTICGTHFSAWCSAMIIRKVTTVKSIHVQKFGGMNEINLIGKDMLSTIDQWRWGCLIFFSLTSVIGGTVSLLLIVGIRALVGLAVIIFIFLFNIRITRLTKIAEKKDVMTSDARVGMMSEVLKGIVPIKLMAWEEPFRDLIQKLREEEARVLFQYRALTITTINLGRASPVIATGVTIITVAMTSANPEQVLSASMVFSTLAAFTALRLPLISIPGQLVQLNSASICFSRIASFMFLDDMETRDVANGDSSIIVENASFSWGDLSSPEVANAIENPAQDLAQHEKLTKKRSIMRFGRSSKRLNSQRLGGSFAALDMAANSLPAFTIRDISFTLPKNGGLCAVVGSVASGKSTLLQGLIGSTYSSTGKIELSDRLSYAPQSPLVIAATIRENILMGQEFDEERYNEAIKNSGLLVDIQEMQDGDSTEVGERGRTLSGGQQARLSLARAFYRNPKLLVLDCPLAAVDPLVSIEIFYNGIWKFCREPINLEEEPTKVQINDKLSLMMKTMENPSVGKIDRAILMVLSEYRYLKYFTNIIVMENGKIVQIGTFAELMKIKDGALFKLVQNDEDLARKRAASSPKPVAPITNINASASSSLKEEHAAVSISDENEKKLGEEAANGNEKPKTLEAKPTEMVSMTSSMLIGKKANGDEPKKENKLFEKETGARGAIQFDLVFEWLLKWGKLRLICSVLLGVCAYSVLALNDLWLANWVSESSAGVKINIVEKVVVYGVLTVLTVILVQLLSINNIIGAVRASKTLHYEILLKLLHATIEWHEKTPSGRLLSRLSADLSTVDRLLGHLTDDLQQFFWNVIALVVVASIVIPPITPVNIISLISFLMLFVVVDRTNRETKRFANLALSPVISNINEAIAGRAIMHASKSYEYFNHRHTGLMNEQLKYSYFSYSIVNFGSLVVGLIGFILSTTAAIIVVELQNYQPALVGLALNYCFNLPYFLGILSITLPMGMQCATSLERVMQLKSSEVVQENYNEGKDKPDNWPSSGVITFQDVSLIYRPGLPPAINHLGFTIPPKSNVIVCGRTGAGKSSIISLLFRIRDPSSGVVSIDGVDISSISLIDLRQNLAIIPQEPLLLSGSIRHNVDPFDKFETNDILNALETVGLPRNLIDKSASNMSAGEKQLINAARLILTRKSTRVLVLDEPSAQLDSKTDKQLMSIIRGQFSEATVITIAHRLENTLPYASLVILLEHGELREFGSPDELLKKENGYLRRLVESSKMT